MSGGRFIPLLCRAREHDSFPPMPLLVLALMVAASEPPPVAPTLTLGEVTGLPPASLAPRLFPQETARKIVGGSLKRLFVPGQSYRLTFWEAPEVRATMVCRRQTHAVTVGNRTVEWDDNAPESPLEKGPMSNGFAFGVTYPEPATSERCAGDVGYFGSTWEDEASTIAVIDRLLRTVTFAKGTTRLPFALSCQADDDDDACANPRELLASVRMDTIIWIERKPTRYRTLSQTRHANGHVSQIIQGDPAAPMDPVIHFFPSGGGRTLRITLIGASEDVREVRLESATVIYH